MPSPFPGMDPFIETRRIWSDFHLDLAAEIRAHLNARIQPGYYATAVTYVTYDVIEVAQAEPRYAGDGHRNPLPHQPTSRTRTPEISPQTA